LAIFKPSFKAYRLQEFKRGFIRAAIETNSPIVPVIVIGAEETHINLQQLKLSKYLRGLVLPIPLNVLPLPARWKIVFLEPIHLPYKPSAVNDSELMHEIAEDLTRTDAESNQQRVAETGFCLSLRPLRRSYKQRLQTRAWA
jgi:1-acyl-sn-glycerol-3-phosphate acyltransferase